MSKVELRFRVHRKDGSVLCTADGENSILMQMPRCWVEGDCIQLESSHWPVCLWLKLDDHIPAARVWLTGPVLEFPVPQREEDLLCYAPGAFAEERPMLEARFSDFPKECYELSINPLDRRGETTYYPHCIANAETRNEAVFAARNTIDGLCDNTSHGHWPYESWGDDECPDAEIKVEFGRPVRPERVEIWLRADFPHDNWWQSGVLEFSDGSSLPLQFEKTGRCQCFAFPPRIVTWAKLSHLQKDPEDPSPWPSLRQWIFWGTDAKSSQL